MRLVQLTALVYVVGFGTDVFDDGASAEMAREVHFVEEMEADADIDGALSDASSGRGAVSCVNISAVVTITAKANCTTT